MTKYGTVRKIDPCPNDLDWTRATKHLDAVAAALLEGDMLRAIKLARVAARELDELAAAEAEAER